MRNYLTMTPVLPGFSSEEKDLTVHEWIPAGGPSGVDRGGPDLVGMARWAMHYLLHNPQKPLGCRCRFHISPLDNPPAPGDDEEDLIAEGDNQLCRQLVKGLKKPASRRGNLMFYEGGAAPWRNGEWLKGCRDHYPGFLDHLVRWAGNDIEEVSPRGTFLPIFAGARRPLPPLGAEGSR